MKIVESLQSKILSDIDLERWLAIVKFKGQKIVFSSGCFDVLHKGHLHHLAQASDLGDYLVIGLYNDASVKRMKGDRRPYLDHETRALLLASMSFVAVIVLLDEGKLPDIIKQIRPDILVKGADHNQGKDSEPDYIRNFVGDVITLNMLAGYSSSEIVNRITAG